MTIAAAAAIVGCSRQTGSKWVNRYRRGEGLEDRSSRPHRSPRRVAEQVEQAVLRARVELRAGPHVIGWATGVAASTVHAILRRHGCSRLRPRLPRGEIVRYERERPGELLHVDVKKLGRIVKPSHRVTGDRRDRSRGAGWQYLFVAIDDASRLAFARIYPDETADSALAFLDACERFYRRHGIRIERVLTDNGTCFKRRWHDACTKRDVAVRKTRPYRPQTNGKAERFIRTLLERWAYAYSYSNEAERAKTLPDALDFSNRYRPHRALGGADPASARQRPIWDEQLARQLAPPRPQSAKLRLELVRELVQRRLAAADEGELALDVRNRLLDDAKPLLVARILLPATSQRGPRLLRLGELDELLERQAEQVAQADQLLEAADVRLGIRPVRTLVASAARAEQPELLVVTDRARRDADALRHFTDPERGVDRAHAAASTSNGSIATASTCTYFPPRMSEAAAATTHATIAKTKA
jgi:transposase InsO family protein